jgi:hypothetical protein
MQSPPDKPLGVAKCWVDDNFAGGKELHGTADVEEVIATLFMIDRGVSRGSHFVCRSLINSAWADGIGRVSTDGRSRRVIAAFQDLGSVSSGLCTIVDGLWLMSRFTT